MEEWGSQEGTRKKMGCKEVRWEVVKCDPMVVVVTMVGDCHLSLVVGTGEKAEGALRR